MPHKLADQFNEIADAIEKHRERFNMEFWMKQPDKLIDDNYIYPKLDLLDEENYCGTVACIGGTADAIAFSKKVILNEYLPFNATETEDLFYANSRYGMGECVWAKYAEELDLPGEDEMPDEDDDDYGQVLLEKITADMAITMLRNLASGKWNLNTH